MQLSPHHFKRKEIKSIINKTLGDNILKLNPLSISTNECLDDGFTTTNFSFSEKTISTQEIFVRDQRGKGFIDSLFMGLQNHYSETYKSLGGIKLFDIQVNPILSKTRSSIGTDAKTSVLFLVHVDNHGQAEFQHKSRSMIYSSFVLALEAFQFYINCERCFDKIQIIIDDAVSRNRGDIIDNCKYKLAKLTEVNNYEQKRKN